MITTNCMHFRKPDLLLVNLKPVLLKSQDCKKIKLCGIQKPCCLDFDSYNSFFASTYNWLAVIKFEIFAQSSYLF